MEKHISEKNGLWALTPKTSKGISEWNTLSHSLLVGWSASILPNTPRKNTFLRMQLKTSITSNFSSLWKSQLLTQDMNPALNAAVQEVCTGNGKWQTGDRERTFLSVSEKAYGKVFQIFYGMTRGAKCLEYR